MKPYWWQETNIYQIYPRSFLDTNGDGIGDIPGIIRKLDYLQRLGVETLWLSPVNRSPMADNGYDISDYYAIDPVFGTNADMERLIEEARKRNIRIVMDLVVNHCSDQHEWFQKALKDPEGPYGDYFFIRKGVNGKEPNNWRSFFEGRSAWERIPGTEYYYLHLFAKKQPDLNWDNPKLREEIYGAVNYWLEKGVAGFRLDSITYLKKEPGLPSYPPDGEDGLVSVKHGTRCRPGLESFLTELRDRTYGREALTVGETSGIARDRLPDFIGLENGFFSMVFDFSITTLDFVEPNCYWFEKREWDPDELKERLFATHEADGEECWHATMLECHDSPRAVSYYLPPEGRNFRGASMLAVMSLCRRGTPVLYQGQELGMTNTAFPEIGQYNDISSLGQYRTALEHGCDPAYALKRIQERSRDNGRYPFSWDASEKAGFTEGTPWLPVADNRDRINAEKELADRDSLFYVYQKLLSLRKEGSCRRTLIEGKLVPYLPEQHHLLAYFRCMEETHETGALLILCNYQGEKQKVELPEGSFAVVYDNMKKSGTVSGSLMLDGFEAAILRRE